MQLHLCYYKSSATTMDRYNVEQVIDMITSGGNASDDSDDDFDGYISDDEVMQVMGLRNRDDDEYNSDGGKVVTIDNGVVEMTDIEDEYHEYHYSERYLLLHQFQFHHYPLFPYHLFPFPHYHA